MEGNYLQRKIWSPEQYSSDLRMYCIDRARVPESHDAHVFYCLYDKSVISQLWQKIAHTPWDILNRQTSIRSLPVLLDNNYQRE